MSCELVTKQNIIQLYKQFNCITYGEIRPHAVLVGGGGAAGVWYIVCLGR
jgi:hypothetical protein